MFPNEYLYTVNGVDIYTISYMDGISLGDRIFVNLECFEGSWLIKHEFGHVVQSRYLGWFYVPLILIPSFMWYCFISMLQKLFGLKENTIVRWYYKFPVEKWANDLMGISYFDVLK